MPRITSWIPARRQASAPAPPADQFRHNLDSCTVDGVAGWAFHPDGIRSVEVLIDGSSVGHVAYGMPRSDVAQALGNQPGSFESGFSVAFPENAFATGVSHRVAVEFRSLGGDGARLERDIDVWPVRVANPPDDGRPAVPLAPLPADVIATLAAIDPRTYGLTDPWGPETVSRAVSDIASMVRTRAIIKPVLRYAHFLQTMSACFRFVGLHFDPFNHLTDPGAKDFSAIASSPDEMLCIANHLYVLRSRGQAQTVVECGCFKGFSTCCLSQACAWLGLTLHVFDSFAGLPPSGGGYYHEGDFRAPIDEVADNVRTFGQLSAVEFHQGFFSETLPGFEDPVGCIWMDVDLESSARDVMGLLPRLPPQSCVFSHELPPEAFVGARPQPDATEVLPPIVEAFAARRWDPMGRHLTGVLGALWAAGEGVPVLAYDEISAIAGA